MLFSQAFNGVEFVSTPVLPEVHDYDFSSQISIRNVKCTSTSRFALKTERFALPSESLDRARSTSGIVGAGKGCDDLLVPTNRTVFVTFDKLVI